MKLTAEQARALLKRSKGDFASVTPAMLVDILPNTPPKPKLTPKALPQGKKHTMAIYLPVKGKSRARTFQGEEGTKTRQPAAYRKWKNEAARQLSGQWGMETLSRIERLDVFFHGGNLSNDGDNGIGSVMDAMTQAGVISNDSLRQVPRGSWDSGPCEVPWIEIKIEW